jgi:flagellar assembly factor FliW
MTPQLSPAIDRVLKDLQKQDAVCFQNGIPGFPEEKKFVLLQNPEERPFIWMQSTTNPELCFIVTSPFIFFPEYRPDVPDDELTTIGSPSLSELMLLTIVQVVNSKPPEVRTNLKAPIIINLKNFAGSQVIVANESMYSERAVYKVKSEA